MSKAASEGVTPGQSGGFVKLLVAVKLQRSLRLQLRVLHIHAQEPEARHCL